MSKNGHDTEAEQRTRRGTGSSPLAKALTALLDEAFAGPPKGVEYGNFTTGPGTGLLDTLQDLSPEAASSHVLPGRPAIAAQVAHVLLSLETEETEETERERAADKTAEPDWDAAWKREAPDETTRDALAREAEAAYRATRTFFLEGVNAEDSQSVTRAISLVVHTAYHLGAMRQLKAILETKPIETAVALRAFASYENALDAISGAQATQMPAGAPYSVAAVLGHMVFWQDFMLARVEGRPLPQPAHDPEGWPEVTAHTFETWKQRFFEGLGRARTLAQDPVVLSRVLSEKREGDTGARELTDLGVHNAHHLGQVILLRRLAGLWPPPGGGDAW